MTPGGVAIPSLELPAIRELAALRQWVCWREDVRRGKPTKVPVTPRGCSASTTDHRTWTTFAECAAALVQAPATLRLAGLGFVLTASDPYVGVDLDKCLNGDALEPWAGAIVEALASYTERSPSGRGLHVLCRGALGDGWHRYGRIERYDRERYFTMTGDHWPGSPESIEERTVQIAAIAGPSRERVVVPLREGTARLSLRSDASPPAEKFEALLSNDRRFRLSWEHRRTDLSDASTSSYDLSLASLAAAAEWSDQEIADLLAAHRRKYGSVAKALRPDYVERTIAMARAGRSEGLSDAQTVLREIEQGTETREEAITRASSQLRIPLRSVLRLGDERPLYAMVLTSGVEIMLGSSADLLQQGRVRAAILDATRGLVVPRLKGENWEQIVGVLVAHAEPVGSDEVAEIDFVAITDGWIRDYLDEAPAPIDVADLRGEVPQSGRPLRRDGRVLIQSAELAQWVALNRGEKLTQRELALRLRAGLHSLHRLWFGPEKKRCSRKYWEINEKREAAPSAPPAHEGRDSNENESWVGVQGVQGCSLNDSA